MIKVLLLLGGLAILSLCLHQMVVVFRDGSFRARGNRLIKRSTHPIIFWMNLIGLVLFGVGGVVLVWLVIAG
jgi:nitric oxide reductase large subunit